MDTCGLRTTVRWSVLCGGNLGDLERCFSGMFLRDRFLLGTLLNTTSFCFLLIWGDILVGSGINFHVTPRVLGDMRVSGTLAVATLLA